MIVKIFDIQNGVVIPTEHCYTLKSLKDVMDNYPNEYLKIYLYLFYMYCPDPDMNPNFNLHDDQKEEMIMKEIQGEFNTDDEIIRRAAERVEQMYETPTLRAYYGIKGALDRISVYMKNTAISDDNISQIISAAEKFAKVRQSFKDTLKDLQDEVKGSVRGQQNLGYDQRT